MAHRHTYRCAECGGAFEAVRNDAATCTPACRARRHRTRERAREAALLAEVERASTLLRVSVALARSSRPTDAGAPLRVQA